MKITFLRTKNSAILLGTGAIGGALITALIFLGVWYAPFESRDESLTRATVNSSTSDRERNYASSPPNTESGLLFDLGSSGSVDETFRIKSDFDQTVALYNLLAGASEDGVLELIDQAKDITQPDQRDAALSIIFSKYANIDPVKAFSLAQEFGRYTRNQLIDSVFHQWARSNLAAAVSTANSLNGEQKEIAARSILVARDDLSLDRLYAIADELQNRAYVQEVTARYWRASALEDPRSAWQIVLLSTNDVRNRSLALATIAEIWIEKEGVKALDEISISPIDESDKTKIYEKVLGRMAKTDRVNAINAATNLKLSPSSSVVLEIFSKWAEDEPHQLFGIADSLDHRFVSIAKRQALEAMARISPQEAVNLVDQVGNPALIMRVSPRIAIQWAYTDPKSSLEWYIGSNRDSNDPGLRFNRDSNDPAIRFIMERLVEENAANAFKIVMDYPGEQGKQLTNSFFDVLLDQVDVDATEFISLLDDDKKQGPVTLLGRKIARSDINKALELEKSIPESGRQDYRREIISAASYPDPFHLYENIDQLPSSDLQSQAALQLVMQDKAHGAFSADQLKDLHSRLDANGRRTVNHIIVTSRYD